MKVYQVIGYYRGWPEDGIENWLYAICSTKEIAERELQSAIKEDSPKDYFWDIEEIEVITE